MTIGSLSESLSSEVNEDFETLVQTRDRLQEALAAREFKSEGEDGEDAKWGKRGKLLLSMGMSSDFEVALKTGSDIVRVGTGVFGQRHLKGES
jgi:PLP dependent protein